MDQAVPEDRWSLLRCPGCAGRLAASPEPHCPACGTVFPQAGAITWLAAPVAETVAAWRTQLRSLVAALRTQASRYREARSRAASPPAQQRLDAMAAACEAHAGNVVELLAPLDIGRVSAAPEAYRALATPLPPGQALTGYYANVHRDWCWGQTENEAAYSAVSRALGRANPGRLLVPGCGAGRLAYDLHVRRRPAVTVAADLNPLMLTVADRMWSGDELSLYEFPLAPRDGASHAVLRRLAAPAPAPPGLWPVVADVTAAPFATHAWDTVVTHWLVDVLDEDFVDFAARVNHWLRPGGRWVNSGSFFVQDPDPAHCHAADELPELLYSAGFEDIELREEVVPYLASPASRQCRMERVVTFSATVRSRPAAPPPRRHAPPWVERCDIPLPLTRDLESHALALRVHAYVASLVDGHRSVSEVAGVLERERLMPADEALAAVQGFMTRLYGEASAPVQP
jgi:SAM-dependent methyltransferase